MELLKASIVLKMYQRYYMELLKASSRYSRGITRSSLWLMAGISGNTWRCTHTHRVDSTEGKPEADKCNAAKHDELWFPPQGKSREIILLN